MKIMKSLMLLGVLFVSELVLAAPKIDHWTTDDGLKVYYVNVPQLPMLDLRLVFAAGGAYSEGNAGVAMMTSSILSTGAGGLDANQLAEKFESVGAGSSAGSARDMAWITLRTLTLEKEQETAIDTWLKVVGSPDFPEKDFARQKKQILLGLQAEKQNPSALAGKAFYKNLYGDHPYALPSNGTEESIKAMTIEQLKVFHKKYFVKQNGMLAIVGAIDKPAAEALSKRISAVLKEGDKAPSIPEVKQLTEAKTVRIPYPSKQAHIMIGQIGDKRGDKDYFTLYVGNHVFGGGGFTSRLMKEIRDERGLSYSVYSYFSPMRELGAFILGLQTKVATTDEAVTVAADLLKTFQENGPTEEEMIAVKKDITGSFPLGVASNADIVSYLGMIGFYDLPLDYLDTFTETIDKITRDDVSDAFKRRIQPDKMLTVIVGGDGSEKKPSAEKEPDEKQVDEKKVEQQAEPKQTTE